MLIQEKMFRDVIETQEKTGQPATVAEAQYNFACAEAAEGRPDEAFADLNHAIENSLMRRTFSAVGPSLFTVTRDSTRLGRKGAREAKREESSRQRALVL